MSMSMSSVHLQGLPRVSLADCVNLSEPSLRIRSEEDVPIWKTTKGYQHYILFLRRLNESVVGQELLREPQIEHSTAVNATIALLDTLDSWIDEIPPLNTPQRFGNLAFRTWGQRLEDTADDLLMNLLPSTFHACIKLIRPYLLISFGSFVRMDYGTGHEAAFGLLLLCLTLVRFFQPNPIEERDIVFTIFLRYLKLCWRLQDIYKLEPAGSHGVWGLDDYSFLGYIFGSSQLRDQNTVSVSSILHPPLSPTNLYNLSISRIHEVKHGPFFEHSPQLYSIATGVPNWGKVNSGLFKMYEAEVLGKRVVVQHLPLGGLVEYDVAASPSRSEFDRTPTPGFDTQTRAPWSSTAVHPSHSASLIALPPTSARTGLAWATSNMSNRTIDENLLTSSGISPTAGQSRPSAFSATGNTSMPGLHRITQGDDNIESRSRGSLT